MPAQIQPTWKSRANSHLFAMATSQRVDTNDPSGRSCMSLSIISYNMHGFNRGLPFLQDLLESSNRPDIFLLQEHWLTPANLNKFDNLFPDYFSFGCSAMANSTHSDILYGRPYGGVMTLISKNLRRITETIFCSEPYTVIKVANSLIVNLCLPCIGTIDRLPMCEDILEDLQSWRDK